MQTIFDTIKQTRAVFAELIDSLSIEAINAVPPGFRNNIGWNFGHIVVSTQGLCYLRTGVKPDYEVPFLSAYGKGTKPEKWIDAVELATLKDQLVSSIQQIEADYHAGVFSHIRPFVTSTYGSELPTIEAVITTTLAHDNLHLGYALAQRRAIKIVSTQ